MASQLREVRCSQCNKWKPLVRCDHYSDCHKMYCVDCHNNYENICCGYQCTISYCWQCKGKVQCNTSDCNKILCGVHGQMDPIFQCKWLCPTCYDKYTKDNDEDDEYTKDYDEDEETDEWGYPVTVYDKKNGQAVINYKK